MELCASASWFHQSEGGQDDFCQKHGVWVRQMNEFWICFPVLSLSRTILLHLLGLYASPIELKLLCREKFTRAFKSIYAGVFSPLYYPWGKRGLIHENVTRFLNECFLRTMKHEKSVMRTNIQDFRTISGTFLYPNPDCWFQKPILCSALQQSTNEVWI